LERVGKTLFPKISNSASVLGFRSLRRRFLFGERLQGNQASVDTANTARHALEGLDFAHVAGGGFTLNIICPKVLLCSFRSFPIFWHTSTTKSPSNFADPGG